MTIITANAINTNSRNEQSSSKYSWVQGLDDWLKTISTKDISLNKYINVVMQKHKLDGNIANEAQHLDFLRTRNRNGEFNKIIKEDDFKALYKLYTGLQAKDKQIIADAMMEKDPMQYILGKMEQEAQAIMIFNIQEGVKAFTKVSLKNNKTPNNETQKPLTQTNIIR